MLVNDCASQILNGYLKSKMLHELTREAQPKTAVGRLDVC